MARGLPQDILTSVPVMSRLEAMYCPGEVNGTEEARELGQYILQAFINATLANSRNGTLDRRLRVQMFLDSRSLWQVRRRKLWERAMLHAMNGEKSCQTTIADLVLDASTSKSITLTLPQHVMIAANTQKHGDADSSLLRHCLLSLAVKLSMQVMETLNVLSSTVIQTGNGTGEPKDAYPFYDVGLDGENEIIAQSDTGVDVNNCYFWDADIQVPRDQSGSVNLNARKVVQYYAYTDSTDVLAGHGTHVAGTLVGRRATNGKTESTGQADGIARAAKLAFFDIGSSTTNFLASPLN